MKKLLLTLTATLVALALFATGAFAAVKWMEYTGEDNIEQASNNVDEIMDILREVNEGKLSAEEAQAQLKKRVDELESMNPSGLAKQNKELREQVKALESQVGENAEYVAHLEAELTEANEQAQEHQNETDAALEEARQYKGDN